MKKDYITGVDDFPDFSEVIAKAVPPKEEDNAQLEKVIQPPDYDGSEDQFIEKESPESVPPEEEVIEEVAISKPTKKKRNDKTKKTPKPPVKTAVKTASQSEKKQTVPILKPLFERTGKAVQSIGLTTASKFTTGYRYSFNQLKNMRSHLLLIIIAGLLVGNLFVFISPDSSLASIGRRPSKTESKLPDSITDAVRKRLIDDFTLFWNDENTDRLYRFMGPVMQSKISKKSFRNQCKAIFAMGRLSRPTFHASYYTGREYGGDKYELVYHVKIDHWPGKVILTTLYTDRGLEVIRFDITKGY